jgi:hypothetical protein
MNELNAPATEFKLPSKRKDEIENYSEICVGDAFVEIGEEDTDKEDLVESFERASADLEIVHAAYPDEIIIEGCNQQRNCGPIANNNYDDEKGEMDLPTWFPLIFTLTLPLQRDEDKFGATITMELPKGYPVSKSLQVVSYRCAPSIKKDVIEHAVSSVKDAASEALHSFGGEECSLSCCAIAIETWKTLIEAEAENQHQTKTGHGSKDYDVKDLNNNNDDDDIEWITSDKTLIDRKSVFQAHLCKVTSEDMTKRAVNKLIEGSTKIQRATHNMVCFNLKMVHILFLVVHT